MADRSKHHWLTGHIRSKRVRYITEVKTCKPCPECGEKLSENIIRLRSGFYECRSCKATFQSDARGDE